MKTLPINNQGPDLYELCRKKSCVNITHQYYVLNTVERYTIVTSLCVCSTFCTHMEIREIPRNLASLNATANDSLGSHCNDS